MTALTEQDLDRARVEVVFGLGGGELHVVDPAWPDEWDGKIEWWYEGVPEYAVEMKNTGIVTCTTCEGTRVDPADGDSDCPSCEGLGHHERETRTAILNGAYGLPQPPHGWVQLAVFGSSGEAQCSWCGDGVVSDDEDDGQTCKLRDGDHLLYLGDGWAEVVYRRLGG